MKKSMMRYGLSLLALQLMGVSGLVGMERECNFSGLDDTMGVEPSMYCMQLHEEAQAGIFVKSFKSKPTELQEADRLAIDTHFQKFEFNDMRLKIEALLADPAKRTSVLYHLATKADATNHPMFVHPFVSGLMRDSYGKSDDVSDHNKTLLLSGVVIELVQATVAAAICCKFLKCDVTGQYRSWKAAFSNPVKYLLPAVGQGNYLAAVLHCVENRYKEQAGSKVVDDPRWLVCFKQWHAEQLANAAYAWAGWSFHLPSKMEFVSSSLELKVWAEMQEEDKVRIYNQACTGLVAALVVELSKMDANAGRSLSAKKNVEIWNRFLDLDLLELTLNELTRDDVKARARK